MKIQSKENVWTASPERSWSAGEVVELPEEVAKQLLTNPNFSAVKGKVKVEKPVPIFTPKRRKRK